MMEFHNNSFIKYFHVERFNCFTASIMNFKPLETHCLPQLHCSPQSQLIKSVLCDILLSITGNVSWFRIMWLWLLWSKRALQRHLCLFTWSIDFCNNHKQIQIPVFIIAVYNILILYISLAYFISEFFRL